MKNLKRLLAVVISACLLLCSVPMIASAFCCDVDLVSPDKAKLEAHKKYADIQIVVQGCEGMEYAPIDTLTVNTEYSSDFLIFA